MSKEKNEFLDSKYGSQLSDIQCLNPWQLSPNPPTDPEQFKKQNTSEKSLLDINQLLSASGLNPADALSNLIYIFKDIFAGDKEALNRPEFQCLNFSAVKKALDWLSQSDQLDSSMRADLALNGWRLNYREKPPTPEEFLTEKYIGGMAHSLHDYIRKAFCDFLNPLKPYRTAVLTMFIGAGKSTLSTLIIMYIALLYSYMWNSWKFFGAAPSTIFTFVFCSWSLKKGSELLIEPFIQILEQSPYYQRVRTHEELIKYSQSTDKMDHLVWTTSTPSSVLSMQNGANFKLLSSPEGLLGQAQPLSEKVKLPDGSFTTIGQLKIGDKIASPTQKESTVLGIFPQGKQKTYQIILSDGRKARCNESHLWLVSNKKDSDCQPIYKIVTTRFLMEHLEDQYAIPDKNECQKYYSQILKAEERFQSNSKDTIEGNFSIENRNNVIKKIEYCGWEEQQCIYLDSLDHLYITCHEIITHNTIIAGVMTELSFFTDYGWSDEKILKFFTKLRQRIDSRMKGNYLSRHIIDSSPNTLESVIDKWIWEEAPKDPKNFIMKGSRWHYIRKEFPEFYDENGNERHDFKNGFPLYKGSGGTPPQVIETLEQLSQYPSQDIIWCPVKQITSSGVLNFKNSANENPTEFMRDWAGVPAGQADRIFSDFHVIDQAFDNNLKSHFSSIVAPKEEEPEHLIWNKVKDKFFNKIIDKYYYYYEPELPRCVSVDLAISGDTASIAMSHTERDAERKDSEGNPLRVYVTDFIINVVPKNSIINLDSFKFFILDLKRLGNLNIHHVSFDGFQSRSIMQSLERNGIKVDLLSVDKNNAPYLSFIDYVFHNRWYCGKNIFVKNNMLSIQMATRKQTGSKKIDHMKGDNVYSDQFCGVDSEYTEAGWHFSQCGKNAKDSLDAIVGTVTLLDTYSNEFIETHVFQPHSRLEKNYETSKINMNNFIGKLGLKIT